MGRPVPRVALRNRPLVLETACGARGTPGGRAQCPGLLGRSGLLPDAPHGAGGARRVLGSSWAATRGSGSGPEARLGDPRLPALTPVPRLSFPGDDCRGGVTSDRLPSPTPPSSRLCSRSCAATGITKSQAAPSPRREPRARWPHPSPLLPQPPPPRSGFCLWICLFRAEPGSHGMRPLVPGSCHVAYPLSIPFRGRVTSQCRGARRVLIAPPADGHAAVPLWGCPAARRPRAQARALLGVVSLLCRSVCPTSRPLVAAGSLGFLVLVAGALCICGTRGAADVVAPTPRGHAQGAVSPVLQAPRCTNGLHSEDV